MWHNIIIFLFGPMAWPDSWYGSLDPSDLGVQFSAWFGWLSVVVPLLLFIFYSLSLLCSLVTY